VFRSCFLQVRSYFPTSKKILPKIISNNPLKFADTPRINTRVNWGC